MQAPTHFLTGIIIAKLVDLCFPELNQIYFVIIVAILAVGSHFLIDALAKMTYHPPEADWHDKFWVIYHVGFVYLPSLICIIIFFIPYWWVMIFSTLPDIIDWYTARAIFHKGPYVHPIIDKFRTKFFSWVPDFRHRKWSVSVEFGLLGVLIIGVILL
ncbi:MAG: hypothetical protein ACTSVU_08535 [Promethearchaeota archaeon]